MSLPRATVWLCLVGVVDRVEGDLAVVEWGPGDLSSLPANLVPGLRVGRGVRVCATRVGRARLRIRTHALPRTPSPPSADLPDAIDLAAGPPTPSTPWSTP